MTSGQLDFWTIGQCVNSVLFAKLALPPPPHTFLLLVLGPLMFRVSWSLTSVYLFVCFYYV